MFRPAPASVLAALLLAACSEDAEPPAGLDVCHRVQLVVADTGVPVVGPEDLAWDPVSGLLFVSAFDRLRTGRGVPGIYAVPASLLAGPVAEVRLAARLEQPHGIGLDTDRRQLAVIDHAGRTAEGLRLSTVRRYDIGADGGLTEAAPYGAVIQANDVVPDGRGGAYVSRDHGADTRLGLWVEDLLGLARASVVHLPADGARATPVLTGVTFANGLAMVNSRLYVAATREDAVRVLEVEAGKVGDAIPMPGSPDNLNLAADGAHLLAAVHPSTLRLGLALRGWADAAGVGSRVVVVDTRDPQASPRLVLDDAEGIVLRGATAAEAIGDRVVIGSVLDDALAVCPMPPAVSP